MRNELDELGEDHPCQESPVSGLRGIEIPVCSGLPEQPPQHDIANECRRRQGCDLDGVSAPWLLTKAFVSVGLRCSGARYLRPDVALSKQTCQITPPVAACPAETLLEELGVVLQGGLDFALRMILHAHLMLVIDKPAGDEIVVIGIQLILSEPPLLVGEAIGEVDILQNARTVGTGPSRDTGHTSIHVRSSSTVEIASLEIECTQEAIYALTKGGILSSAQSLTGDDSPIDLILERRQDPLQQLDRPVHIIVSKDNDLGTHFRNSSSHLPSLVCLLDRHASQAALLTCRHLADRSLRFMQIVVDRDQDQLVWLVGEY
jgi:hypothetical protein